MEIYDVALSFAGEDREIAKEIASHLRDLGYSVFFDEFAIAEIWGRDLNDYLVDIFRSKARYCIILLSDHYIRKPWPTLERRSAQLRALSSDKEPYILPVRLDDCRIPAPLESLSYIDLRHYSISYLVEQFQRKIQPLNSKEGSLIPHRSDMVRLTRVKDLANPDWQGYPIQPVASLDVWIRYNGRSQLFIDRLKFYHLETTLLSGASGIFPPSHRYKIEYESNCIIDRELNPPLLINPSDQEEIHFEVEISPKSDVGGWSCCVLFLLARTSDGRTARLPVISPYAQDLVACRVLKRNLAIDLARLFQQGYYHDLRIPPPELGPGRNIYLLEPDGSIAVPLEESGTVPITQESRFVGEDLRPYLEDLQRIALDPAESETIGAAAISLLGFAGDQSVRTFISEMALNGSSRRKRYAASDALVALQKKEERSRQAPNQAPQPDG